MEQKKMKMREMLIGLCMVAVLALVTFHVLFQNHSMETMGETFRRAELKFVVPAFFCMFVFINCEAANIRLLMKTFHKKVPYRRPCPIPLQVSISAPSRLLPQGDSPCSCFI